MHTKAIIAVTLSLLLLCSTAVAEIEVEYYVLATADPTWVRSSPGLGDNIVDKLTPDTLYEWGGNIEVDSRGVDWYDVFYGSGKYGWISGLHGNLVNQFGQPYTDHSVSLGHGTSIRANADVNVRLGPGKGYTTLGTLYKGETADYTGTSERDSNGQLWYQINFYDNRGWVSAKYTSIK